MFTLWTIDREFFEAFGFIIPHNYFRNIKELYDADDAEDYTCYLCGNNLEVGVDSTGSICWHCKEDEYDTWDDVLVYGE